MRLSKKEITPQLREDFRRTVQIGDVLGMDVDLPEDLERLNGWLVYNITEEGVPQVLEPTRSAVVGVVTWYEANEHVKEILKEQGHENARLWTEADGMAIFKNIIKGGYNDKAQLDIGGYNPTGSYWQDIEDKEDIRNALVCYPDNGRVFWRRKNDNARVRAVQDVSELSFKAK